MVDNPEPDDLQIVCRCNDVTVEDIETAIDSGLTEFELLRKHLRIGMGPCQGRTCLPLLRRIFSQQTGLSIKEVPTTKARSPIVPVRLSFLRTPGDSEGNIE